MDFRFDDTFRNSLAGRLAAFERFAAPGGAAGLKRAAVAVTLVGSGPDEAALVLTQRAAGLRAHAGQWALPGGRCDAGESEAEAALRELDEEIGLRLCKSDVLGLLDDYPTRSGYLVTPVVVWAAESRDLRPNAGEVASVHRIPLAEIMRPGIVDFVAIAESPRKVIRMAIAGDLIHAPTAALIYQFRELLAGRVTRVHDLEQPLFAWR
jgi:8-oxo-dGTP pyrophosphatase MutT (NUDIX family)